MNTITAQQLYQDIIDESLSIEVTTCCNSNCIHCFARSRKTVDISLPLDLTKNIITEGYSADYRHLHITGGEPLLWKELFPALDYAFETGFKTVLLNTNGTLLTREICKRFSNYKALSISLSIEGPESLHNRIRGTGSWKRSLRGLERALDTGLSVIIFSTVFKSLLPDLPYFADNLFNEYPEIKYLILIQFFSPNENRHRLTKELLAPKYFLQLVKTVSLLNLSGLKICIKNNPLASVVSKILHMPWIPPMHSLYRNGSMMIKANRHICLSHSSSKCFGRYEPGSIHKIRYFHSYQKAVGPDKEKCPGCEYFTLCSGNGLVRPPESRFDLHPDTPYCIRVLDLLKTS